MNVPQTIDDWTALVEAREPFTYANIGGDGEMLTVTGWRGTNSDGKESRPEKQKALARCLTETRYTFAGYNPGKKGTAKLKRAEDWLRKHGINVPERGRTTLVDPDYGNAKINVRWVHKEIIGAANTSGRLNGFLHALAARDWLVVVSDNCDDRTLRKMGASVVFVVPKTWGWRDLDQIEGHARRLVAMLGTRPVVTWGLGYLAKVLVWRLAAWKDGRGITHVDMGACFDPYCGALNRSGYRRPEWPDMMRRNLAGLV